MAILGNLLQGYEFGLFFLWLFSVGVAFYLGGKRRMARPTAFFLGGFLNYRLSMINDVCGFTGDL